MAESGRSAFLTHLGTVLEGIEAEGLMKRERLIHGPQGAHVEVAGRKLLNLCANNYLGLADDPRLIAAAKSAMQADGYGMASVRFICGTQDIHRALEARYVVRAATPQHQPQGLQRSGRRGALSQAWPVTEFRMKAEDPG